MHKRVKFHSSRFQVWQNFQRLTAQICQVRGDECLAGVAYSLYSTIDATKFNDDIKFDDDITNNDNIMG